MPKFSNTALTGEDGSLVTSNRIFAGALLGSQIVWLCSVIPTYRRLTPPEYVKVHSLLTWYGDGLMPAVGFSATLTGYLRYRRSGSLNALVGTAALTAAGIGTLPNHRINIRIRELRPDADVPLSERDLHRDRDRWAAARPAPACPHGSVDIAGRGRPRPTRDPDSSRSRLEPVRRLQPSR